MPVHKQSSQRLQQQGLALDTDRQFFRCLRENGPMSRAAISQLTGISRPTISEAAGRLQGQSLVNETKKKTQNKQGRAGILYEINANRGVTLSVALDSQHIQMRLTDLAENIVAEEQFKLAALNGHAIPDYDVEAAHVPSTRIDSSEAFFQKLTTMAEDMVARTKSAVLAIGISIADPVNSETGQVLPLHGAPFPLAHDINFPSLFASMFHCPITIDNDVNWATMAERSQGNAIGEKNFMFFYFGRGIGAGIYINGHLIRGSSGIAGEVGYFKVDGSKNLQDYVVENQLGKALLENRSLYDHPAMDKIIHVISNAGILVNPDLIVIGGPLSRHDAFMKTLKDTIPQKTLMPTRVIASAMPDTAPLCGASAGAHELALASLGLIQHPE